VRESRYERQRLWSNAMIPDLERADYLGSYRLRLTFADGKVGEVDLSSELWGEVFEPLKDPEYFKLFRLDPDLGTIVWQIGADFAPEYLYQAAA
jgi:hypothetical protein